MAGFSVRYVNLVSGQAVILQEVPALLGIPGAVAAKAGCAHDHLGTTVTVAVGFATVANALGAAAAVVQLTPFFEGAFRPQEMDRVETIGSRWRSGRRQTVQ